SPDVIFAEDGWIEDVRHCACEHTKACVSSSLLGLLAGLRNAQTGNHLAKFLPCRDVAEADFAELLQVEQGQALGKQFAVDDPLAEARNDAKADPAGKLVERGADAAEVVAVDMLEAV